MHHPIFGRDSLRFERSRYTGWAQAMAACIFGHGAVLAWCAWAAPGGSSWSRVLSDFLQLHFVRHARQSLREGETTVGFASALLFNLGIQTLPGCTLKLYTLFKHHDVWMFMQKKYEDPQLKRGPETLIDLLPGALPL